MARLDRDGGGGGDGWENKALGPGGGQSDILLRAPYVAYEGAAVTRYVAAKSKDDVDKLARAVNDALTMAAVWEDDGQVAVIHAYKLYAGVGQRAGVRVEAMSL